MKYLIVIVVTAVAVGSLTYLQAQESKQPLGSLGEMRTLGHKLAGYPEVGAEVEVHLAKDAQFNIPAQFKPAPATVSSLRGQLIAFDQQWVGLESQTGSKVWIPREHVALVLEERPLKRPAAKEKQDQQ